eukprot:CAMPEP_0172063438 /NCGR_PEP_ID=MMETSP1043-20130122/9572_1 /TAXON_ID=464988 /ORGANISM="Hemiselmis andersenii, Strain CCMP441" /LENGTH=416 /DNA_ID=CAMNT_0012723419 /DNA_START=74 /DNA_END=1321 /DNA_ORIENTATION=+
MGWLDDKLTRDTFFGVPIDDLLSYQTVKVVRIQDRSIGFMALLGKCAVLLYVMCFLMFGQNGYLHYEPVAATASGKLLGSLRGLNTSELSYCQGGGMCRFVDIYSAVAPDPEPNSIFITTYMREHEQKRQCAVGANVCDRRSPFQTVATREYYVAGVEQYHVLISQEAQATQFFHQSHDERFKGDMRTMDGKVQSYRDDGTGRKRDITLREFKAGSLMLMTVGEIVEAAGFGWGDILEGEHQPIRQSGVVINCYLTYDNTWATFNPAPKIRYRAEFVPGAMQVRKTFTEPVGFGDSRMLVERVGVRVVFKQDGMLGAFSWLSVMRTLVIVMLLFAILTWAIDTVATRYLPLAERYEDAKYEFTENLFNMRQANMLEKDQVLQDVPAGRREQGGGHGFSSLYGSVPTTSRSQGDGGG